MEKFVVEACDVLVRSYDIFKTTEEGRENENVKNVKKPSCASRKGKSYLALMIENFLKEGNVLSDVLQKECHKVFRHFSDPNHGNLTLDSDFVYKLATYKFQIERGRVMGNIILYQVLDDCMNISTQYTYKSKGSKADGVNIPHGDYDIMTILNQVTVRGTEPIIDEPFPVLIFKEDNAPPGFVHLQIPPSRFADDVFRHWGKNTPYGRLVSNEKFKEFFIDRYRTDDVCVNGPCISSRDKDIDHLFCLRSKAWPAMLQPWFYRARSAWPPADVVNEIKEQGVIFVPKGVRISDDEFTDLEWRFSMDEGKLVQSFNQVQMLCYTMMKYLKQGIDVYAADCTFATYIIKTALFWIFEEVQDNLWEKKSFLNGLLVLQNRLRYWLLIGFCPNYFVPEINLFAGHNDRKSREKLEFLLANALNLFLQNVNLADTPRHVSLKQVVGVIEKENPIIDKCKSIIVQMKIVRRSLSMCTFTQINKIMQNVVFRLVHFKLSYFLKGLYALIFCYCNQISAQMTDIMLEGNKASYNKRKKVTSMLLVGTKADALTVLLATYFYQNKQYQAAVFLTQYAMRNCTKDKHLICDGFQEDLIENYLEESKWNTNVSFLKRFSRSFIDLVYLLPHPRWFIPEINIDVGFTLWLAHPLSFAYFIEFLCYYKLKLKTLSEHSISTMLKAWENGKLSENSKCSIGSLILITKACVLVSYHEQTLSLMQELRDLWNNRSFRLK